MWGGTLIVVGMVIALTLLSAVVHISLLAAIWVRRPRFATVWLGLAVAGALGALYA